MPASALSLACTRLTLGAAPLSLALAALTLAACGGGGDGSGSDAGTFELGARDTGAADAGPDPLAACLAGVTPLPNAAYASTNRFESADGTITLAFVIQPDPDSLGTSGTAVFVARGMALSISGTLHCLTTPAELDYQVTHHNFDDTLSVTVADTVYTWKVDLEDYGAVPAYTLTIAPPDTQTTVLPLTALGCSTVPTTHRCFGASS